MLRFFEKHPVTRRLLAICISVVFVGSSFPSITIACEGGGEELSTASFQAENPANTNIEVKTEQENGKQIEFRSATQNFRVWCASGVTFATQHLTEATEKLFLNFTWPTSCKATLSGSEPVESVVKYCPLIEVFANGSLSNYTCELEIKASGHEKCEVTFKKQGPVANSVTYDNVGAKPKDITATIATPATLGYTTNLCGIPSGTNGEFLAYVFFKGYENNAPVGVIWRK